MNNEYKVVNIDNNNRYDLFGIKLYNGKSCCYWKNKGNNNINEVIVIMNNKSVVNINNNQICVSLDGASDFKNQQAMLRAFLTEISKLGIDVKSVRVRFVVSNKSEEIDAKNLISSLKINGVIEKTADYNKPLIVEETSKELEAKGNNSQISKYDNGIMKKYTVSDDKIYDDNDDLSLAELKRIKLAEWMNNQEMMQQIAGLSKDELDRRLTEAVTLGKKVHYLESSNNTYGDRASKLANNKAYEEDGKVNTELGVVRNNVSNSNQFSAVERDNDNVRMVNPNVTSYTVGSSGMTSSDSGSSEDENINDVNNEVGIDETEQQKREEVEVYYLGSALEIYDKDGKIIGKVGVNGYVVDENNNLVRNNNVVGVIGDINDMGVNKTNNKSNVRVLKKPERTIYQDSNKSAAFISLPVIIFIISLLLLIVSGIILFLIK